MTQKIGLMKHFCKKLLTNLSKYFKMKIGQLCPYDKIVINITQKSTSRSKGELR